MNDEPHKCNWCNKPIFDEEPMYAGAGRLICRDCYDNNPEAAQDAIATDEAEQDLEDANKAYEELQSEGVTNCNTLEELKEELD